MEFKLQGCKARHDRLQQARGPVQDSGTTVSYISHPLKYAGIRHEKISICYSGV